MRCAWTPCFVNKEHLECISLVLPQEADRTHASRTLTSMAMGHVRKGQDACKHSQGCEQSSPDLSITQKPVINLLCRRLPVVWPFPCRDEHRYVPRQSLHHLQATYRRSSAHA